MDRQTQIPRNNVPVGYSTPDTKIVLQDENGQAVGENEIGEIMVSVDIFLWGIGTALL